VRKLPARLPEKRLLTEADIVKPIAPKDMGYALFDPQERQPQAKERTMAHKAMPASRKAYHEEFAGRVIEMLEKGTAPWQKP